MMCTFDCEESSIFPDPSQEQGSDDQFEIKDGIIDLTGYLIDHNISTDTSETTSNPSSPDEPGCKDEETEFIIENMQWEVILNDTIDNSIIQNGSSAQIFTNNDYVRFQNDLAQFKRRDNPPYMVESNVYDKIKDIACDELSQIELKHLRECLFKEIMPKFNRNDGRNKTVHLISFENYKYQILPLLKEDKNICLIFNYVLNRKKKNGYKRCEAKRELMMTKFIKKYPHLRFKIFMG